MDASKEMGIEESMEEELSLEQVFNATNNGFIATDTSGHIAFVNRQAEVILGFARKKSMGAHILDILPRTGPLAIKWLETGEPQVGRHIPAD